MAEYQDSYETLRTFIPDDAPVHGVAENEYIFTDEQLEQFLVVAKGSVLRATAYANYALASSEALISKVIKTQDLSTDGAKVAEALIAKGDAMMKRADKEEEDDNFAFFQMIDFPVGDGRPELTEPYWRW